ncbi:Phage integrase (plasmid) [Trichormus variabilis ATCC 29413]|uniref:Phage integrase n=2 Tax=Anabaena variabilis TaxID=264691 RepID=Q3M2R0_TRIV2|nr:MULTISPECIES: site-specific integrase [Nostocaceae]ABA24726.1 Phage integrase [Trichormus variabilis ATCC 29413]MBC1218087.1 tyrosine-type recombinase/integrase [Trichormus variabilis ARAD]MBC1259348.1 tyrosine-type recombinase/integrase [Trichormus variabilis V5]MBC1270869.1 tyrosine-type recombinase/integrase [Trichormus variabilis FSR]MBC1305711.1 tyrosine-type recombinase/integrase [Trichormus variabilis N2B]
MSRPRVQSLLLTTPPPVTLHPAAVYLAGLALGSRLTIEQALNAIARLISNGECDAYTLNWAALRYQHTAAIRTALMQKYAPATTNKMLCALRRVLKEALRLELMDATDYAKAVDFKNVKVKRKLRGRALTSAEIAALIEVCLCDPTPCGVRDAALIAILRGAGVRRAEVVNLELRDLSSNGALEIRQGKGDKDRTVYLPTAAMALVEDWLRVRGRKTGALLCPIRKGGQVQLRRMTPQAVLLIVRKRASESGVESFSPHDFRRTFCSDLLDSGTDIVTVQKLAGHASPATTSKYDRRGEETKRLAVENLSIPYTPRQSNL